MAKPSDFGQKLLDDLLLRKQKMISTRKHGTESKGGCREIVPLKKSQKPEQLGDLPTALAFALKKKSATSVINFLQRIQREGAKFLRTDRRKMIKEKLFDFKDTDYRNYSIEIGRELMKGGVDLEESIKKVLNLEASGLMIEPRREGKLGDLEIEETNDGESEKIAKEKRRDRQASPAQLDLDPPRFSFDKPKNSLTITNSNKIIKGPSESKTQKGRIPNVIARLMGLEHLPEGIEPKIHGNLKAKTNNDSKKALLEIEKPKGKTPEEKQQRKELKNPKDILRERLVMHKNIEKTEIKDLLTKQKAREGSCKDIVMISKSKSLQVAEKKPTFPKQRKANDRNILKMEIPKTLKDKAPENTAKPLKRNFKELRQRKHEIESLENLQATDARQRNSKKQNIQTCTLKIFNGDNRQKLIEPLDKTIVACVDNRYPKGIDCKVQALETKKTTDGTQDHRNPHPSSQKKQGIDPGPQILEPLTKTEKNLKQILSKSQEFVDSAGTLFNLNIPSGIKKAENLKQENKNILDCGYEVLERKRKTLDLFVYSTSTRLKTISSLGTEKIRCMDDLTRQLQRDTENIRSYGLGDSDYLDRMLEKDVENKEPDLNCMWDMGWNDHEFVYTEKDEVVRDVEKRILNGLLDEFIHANVFILYRGILNLI